MDRKRQEALRNPDARPVYAGWAPGNYERVCADCRWTFVGDKRAIRCAACAYGDKEVRDG